jgi:CheY-like chemotaxis protein
MRPQSAANCHTGPTRGTQNIGANTQADILHSCSRDWDPISHHLITRFTPFTIQKSSSSTRPHSKNFDMAKPGSSPVQRIGPILLVDEHDEARASVREALEDEGFTVAEATNGQQALDFLLRRTDDRAALIILDLQAPVIVDGWQLLELLRCYVGLSTIPIIVTGHDARGAPLRHPKIFACIEAPYSIEDLVDTVNACLRGEHQAATWLAS